MDFGLFPIDSNVTNFQFSRKFETETSSENRKFWGCDSLIQPLFEKMSESGSVELRGGGGKGRYSLCLNREFGVCPAREREYSQSGA